MQRLQCEQESSSNLKNQKFTSANSLAEDEGEVVLGFFVVAQVLETQSFQEADQTLIINGKLVPCQKEEEEDTSLNIRISWQMQNENQKVCHYLDIFQGFLGPLPAFSTFPRSSPCAYRWPCTRSRCTSSPGWYKHVHTNSQNQDRFSWLSQLVVSFCWVFTVKLGNVILHTCRVRVAG